MYERERERERLIVNAVHCLLLFCLLILLCDSNTNFLCLQKTNILDS